MPVVKPHPALRAELERARADGSPVCFGVVSDTHLQDGQALPGELVAALDGVGVILHAGDLTSPGVIRQLEQIAPVVAVRGNMDSPALHEELAARLTLEVYGRRIGLMHGSGAPGSLPARVRQSFDRVDTIVFGHSHGPMKEVIDGVLMFNPGSPTDRRFAPRRTCGILTVAEDGQIEAEIVELD